MKKTTRVLVALLALTLVTSCFVGGTFAKYVVRGEGSDTARVAKFGVEISAESDLFAASYDDSAISVLADDGTTNVVAPGTEGTATLFTIAGAPEVDVDVSISLGNYTKVTLPAGTYANVTTADTTDVYTLDQNYCPVQWTLSKDGTEVVSAMGLEKIEEYLGSISKKYEVENGDFADIVGTYELSWTWAFEVNDAADTTLGNIAAGVDSAEAEVEGNDNYVANESFAFTMEVVQVD